MFPENSPLMDAPCLSYDGMRLERGTMQQDHPIGFFDSGSGGISVLKAFQQVMPSEDFLYFGDHQNLPYGDKDPGTIRELTKKACDRLAEQGIKALVVACNTASTATLDELVTRYPFPVLGIEPPLQEASNLPGDGAILVMATPATLRSARFRSLASAYHERFSPFPCPGLAELVEAEDETAQRRYLKMRFAALPDRRIDAIALGCTHYPLIKPLIVKAFGRQVPLIDGYREAALTLQEQLKKAGQLTDRTRVGEVSLSSSGTEEALSRMRRFISDHQTSSK